MPLKEHLKKDRNPLNKALKKDRNPLKKALKKDRNPLNKTHENTCKHSTARISLKIG